MDETYFEEVNLDAGEDWEMIDSNEISIVPASSENDLDILAILIDILAPLATLKTLLGQKLGADLSHCEIWLQDVVQLTDETTLAEQCIQGVGLVQVNLELKSVENIDRINILDVLKPQQEDGLAEELSAMENFETISTYIQPDAAQNANLPELNENNPNKLKKPNKVEGSVKGVSISPSCSASPARSQSVQKATPKVPVTSNENITRWVVDTFFRKEQERMKIPLDPSLWSHSNVQYWFSWAINQFHLKGVKSSQWTDIDGPALCNMSHAEFMQRIPVDPTSKDPNHDLFWTHLELLRKCKFVGVIQKPVPYLQYVTTPLTVKQDSSKTIRTFNKDSLHKKIALDTLAPRSFSIATSGNRASIPGSNGQVQLWQFLLELLTDRNFRDAISWLGSGGEFKLNNPEMVAQLWGERKNKPHMNYEKLSRALRYYYDGDMICKVSGKRFVYKFVCDLKQLLGYSADELNRLVTECDLKAKAKRAHPI